MASLHLPPSAAGNTSASDSGASNPQFTPVSNSSEEEYPGSTSAKSPVGNLRLQTNFDNRADAVSDIEEENGYDSLEELERKDRRARSRLKFTPEEEREVVKVFDRRLVPFLALLYLLAFLDRSSK